MANSKEFGARPGVAGWNISARDDASAEEFYRSAIRDWYGVSEVDRNRTFFTQNRIYQFGDYVIGQGRSVGQVLARGPDEIRRSGLDSVAIMLDLAGMKGDVAGRDVKAAPGSFHVRDHARPSAAKVEAVDVVTLAMPRDRAPGWLTEPAAHGMSIDGTSLTSRRLSGLLMAILERAPGLSVDEGVACIEDALALAEAAFAGAGMLTTKHSDAAYRKLRAAAVVLIDQRLHEPALKIDDLLRALGVSRATLFRAFASSGGINLYIKQRRLERARGALLGRIGNSPSVAEIAHAHGFVSESHFSRSFRDRFGQPPGGLQAALPAIAEDPGGMRYDLLLGWMAGKG